ncbi:MAG: Hsp20/alpha crystallin family protein [Acidimicrobiales bacterium]
MLVRFDPFRDLDRLNRRSTFLGLDAHRKDDVVTVRFDLPGVDADSIDITVEKNQLKVSAERTSTVEEGVSVLVSERPHGSFARSLRLGENLDADGIVADYTDGVLTLTIPVAETSKSRKIPVGTGAAGELAN